MTKSFSKNIVIGAVLIAAIFFGCNQQVTNSANVQQAKSLINFGKMGSFFKKSISVMVKSEATAKSKAKSKKFVEAASTPVNLPSDAPQFVTLSFDGSKSSAMWQSTMNFARKMKEQGITVKFTYFISGVYFLTYQDKAAYNTPAHKPGNSGIGFADNNEDIIERIGNVNQAIVDGHEIASHVNGHYDGSGWSLENWNQEFSEFIKLVFHAAENNHFTDQTIKINLEEKDMVGFRAPVLGKNDNLWTALKTNGYRYDASQTAAMGTWPNKMANGLWNFPLASVTIAHTKKHALTMDYNFYFAQSGANDTIRKGTPAWDEAYRQVYDTYMNQFNYTYKGNRAPIIIGHHFSTWNDAVYWAAMKNFATDVCGQPNVQCVTMRELADYLDSHSTN